MEDSGLLFGSSDATQEEAQAVHDDHDRAAFVPHHSHRERNLAE